MGNSQQKPKETLANPQENKLEKEEEVASTFTCEICYEPMLSNNKFDNNSRCVHPFCTECIAKYIHVKAEDRVVNIECPGLNCNELLDPLTCRPIILPQLFVKWCDNLCESAILRFDTICYCPYRSCNMVVVNECGGVLKKAKCPNCKKFFCFKCKIPWHSGHRCKETGQMINKNDALFWRLFEREKWARCPRCGHCVALHSGCSVIRCRCQTKFCYTCGKPYTSDGSCGCTSREDRKIAIIYFSIFLVCIVVVFSIPGDNSSFLDLFK